MVTMGSFLSSSRYEGQHQLNAGMNPRMSLTLGSHWSYVHTQLTMNRKFLEKENCICQT